MVSSPPSTELKSAEAENGIHPRPMNVPWFSAKEDKFSLLRMEILKPADLEITAEQFYGCLPQADRGHVQTLTQNIIVCSQESRASVVVIGFGGYARDVVGMPLRYGLPHSDVDLGVIRRAEAANVNLLARDITNFWSGSKEQFEVDRVENKGFGFMGCDGILVRLSFQTGLPVDVIFFVCLPFPFDTDLDERQVATFDRWIEHARNCRLPYAILAGTN